MKTEPKTFMKVILGKEKGRKEVNLQSYTDERGNYRQQTEDGVSFAGHRVLWAFKYEPTNYLKESYLSGDEWRKGGYMQITRNGVSVFKEFCRTPERAFVVMQYMLPKLQDFNWEDVKVGHKLYNHDKEAVITSICDDGEIIVKSEDGKPFMWAFQKEEIKEEGTYDDEWGDEDRVHVLSEHLYWHRN